MTIISVCLIVSRPWFIKLYPSKLVSLIKEIPSRRSTKKSSERSNGRKGLFSSFARLSESPPAVDVSRGAPFQVDIEKYQVHDIVGDACETVWSTPNLLLRLFRPVVTEWLRFEEGWRVSDVGVSRSLPCMFFASFYACSHSSMHPIFAS